MPPDSGDIRGAPTSAPQPTQSAREPGLLETLGTVLAAVPIPQILIGGDGRVMLANDGARRLFATALEGRHYIAALRHPAILDCVEAVLRDGGPGTALYPARDGMRDMTWQVMAGPVDLPDEQGALVTFEDKTALEEAGQIRRDFIANVSHELRTPLTALLGLVETLRGAARHDPAAQARFLAVMAHEGRRMNRLVQDLLSLSRVESDERVRPNAMVDLGEILMAAIVTLRPLAAERGVVLPVLDAEARHVLAGDADQLSQVFTNLLENAIKYGRAGGEVGIEITHSAREPSLRGPAVRVTVSDCGDGIAPEHLPRLTERFYRIDNHRSHNMGGTGLGLAIVKHIVSRHRGRLRIDSTPGEGSRFTVILPSPETGSQ